MMLESRHKPEANPNGVDEIRFNFMTAEEVRRHSVVKITNPTLLDSFDRPTPGGLYDQAMGPIDEHSPCKTCDKDSYSCNGHYGHIELVSAAYNPLLFNLLHTLLQRTCFGCFRFRSGREKVKKCISLLELIAKGRVIEARSLEDSTSSGDADDSPNHLRQQADSGGSNVSYDGSVYSGAEDKLNHNREPLRDSFQFTEAMSILKLFLGHKLKKCEYCGYKGSPKITKPTFGWLRLDGGSPESIRANIIMTSRLGRAQRESSSEVVTANDLLNNDLMRTAETESVTSASPGVRDGGRDDPVFKSIDATLDIEQKSVFSSDFLPSEAKDVMKLLWENEAPLCSFIAEIQREQLNMSSTVANHLMFFLDAVCVSAIKFRPPAKGGDGVMEHPHTVLLSKVLQANTALGNAHVHSASRSQIIRRWIDLQQCINVLYDSKTATGQSQKDGISGICQLLEKKEGIFRQNMMGKRVNFACRSVISPDPYLAVNEIGIPPYFAQRLTYPEDCVLSLHRISEERTYTIACMTPEALEQLCMENSQILPWIWVIEALASSKSVDTSLLLQLAKIIPDKYGEMGKNAREAVLLRILEGLAARDDEENDSISDSGERIRFDPSESCEDVLQHILEDAQASDVVNGGLKMLKWDIQSFIASKRASLNSPVLQKLKDAIIEGSHYVIESLKEKSGIAVRTRYNNNVSANGGHSDVLVQRREERDINMEAVESSKTSNFTSAEECDDELQENVPKQNLLPAKRNRSHVTAEISERQVDKTITAEDCCDPQREATKKHKQAENCPRHDSVGVTITSSQHEIPVKPSENLVENVVTEVHRSDKDAEVEDSEFVASPNNLEKRQAYDAITAEDCCDPVREAAKKHKQAENCPRHDNVGVTVTSSQHEIPVKPSENLVENVETEMHRPDKEADVEDEFVVSPNSMEDQEMLLRGPANPMDEDNGKKLSSPMQGQNDKIGEGHRGREGNELRTSNDTLLPVVEPPNTVDKAIEFNHEYHAAGAAETNDHIEHDQDPEATGDGEEYHDETSDMNSMKNAFLSAQCTFSQDSLATQLKLCMKCNNGGKVLVCSSDTCPIVVHESCLCSTVNLDCEGRFYCPFCAYSRAISEYLEVRKRATLARKFLAIFIGQKADNQKLTEGSDKSKFNESKRNDNLTKRNVPNNNRASTSGINRKSSRANVEDRGKTIPTIPCARDKAPCTQKRVDVAREAPCLSENTDLDGENTEQECRPPSRQGVPQNVGSLPLKRPEGVMSPDTEKRFSDVNGRDTRSRRGKKISKEWASPAEALHDPTEIYED